MGCDVGCPSVTSCSGSGGRAGGVHQALQNI